MVKKFGNSLDEYRATRSIGLLTPRDEWPAIFLKHYDEDEKNLRLLGEFFGLEVFSYRELCIRLAAQSVPAFNVKPKRGRPPLWNEYLGGVLVVELEAKEVGNGIAWAATQLAKNQLWRARFASQDSKLDLAEIMRTRYYEYRDRPFSKVMRDAYQYHNAKKIGPLDNPYHSPDGWLSLVAEALSNYQDYDGN